jgi:hypothetical protein
MYVFRMGGSAAEEFFRRVTLLEEDNEENRTKILIKMAKEGLIESVMETQRTKEQYVKDIGKEFKLLDLTENNDGC